MHPIDRCIISSVLISVILQGCTQKNAANPSVQLSEPSSAVASDEGYRGEISVAGPILRGTAGASVFVVEVSRPHNAQNLFGEEFESTAVLVDGSRVFASGGPKGPLAERYLGKNRAIISLEFVFEVAALQDITTVEITWHKRSWSFSGQNK